MNMIPSIQPTALYQFSGTQLQQLITEIVNNIKVEPTTTYAEMTTRQVREHLSAKGYRVKGTATLPSLLKRLGIPSVRRGREDWYPTALITQIPPKTIKR